jgi:hypothetical protein
VARCSSPSKRATAGSTGGWSSSRAGDPTRRTPGTAPGSSSAGPETTLVAALGPTFARYEAEDVARALRAKAELFGQVEDEVASRFAT